MVKQSVLCKYLSRYAVERESSSGKVGGAGSGCHVTQQSDSNMNVRLYMVQRFHHIMSFVAGPSS